MSISLYIVDCNEYYNLPVYIHLRVDCISDIGADMASFASQMHVYIYMLVEKNFNFSTVVARISDLFEY